MVLLLLLPVPGILPAQSPSPVQTANQLYRYLAEEGFQPARQPLAQEGDFPYSILLRPGAPVSGTGAAGGRLIVSIPQEAALRCLGELAFLLRVMDGAAADITLALLANETPPLPFDGQWHPGGSQVLLDSISDPESCTIVMLDSPSRPPHQVRVVPGAGGMMSPLWLLQRLSLPVPHNSLITYRLNLAAEDPALAACLRAGMAAVGVQFDAGEGQQVREVFFALESLVRDFPAEGGAAGQVGSASENYMALPFLGSTWIEEEVFILLYLLIAVLVLALLSGLSFLGKRGSMNRRAFFKLWYLIPVIILLSTLFLWLGQEAAAAVVEVAPKNAAPILGAKTLLSFIIVSLPFIFHLRLGMSASPSVYGYLLTIMAALNIFIFTSIDLVLLFVFVVEYLVVYLSRLARRIVPLFLSSFLMLVPFVPYLLSVMEFAQPERLLGLVYTGIGGNMLCACVLAPFQIMWLRILARIDIFGEHRNMGQPRRLVAAGVVMAAMVASVVLSVTLGSLALYRSFPDLARGQGEPSPPYRLEAGDGQHGVQIEVAQSGYLELKTVTVGVSSPLPVLRYDVRVLARSGLPVYDSAMDFLTMQDNHGSESRFLIPDYPAGDSTLGYTAASGMEQQVRVTVYVAVSPGKAAAVERTVILPAIGGAG